MFDKLDRRIRKWRKHHCTPGIVVAITDPHETVHISAAGVEELSTREPVTPGTLVEIGSVTKTFTGLAIAQLVDRGKLNVDASIREIIPWIEYKSDHPPFTARHLVTHTAGLPSGRADLPSTSFRARAIGTLRGSAPPGTFFSYSDFGFHLLTLVIEQVAQQPYPHYIRENIFRPLGMTDSEPAMLNSIRPRLACAYESIYDDRPYVRKHQLLAGPWYEHTEGDGCIASTALDMSAFLRLLLNHGAAHDGHPILSAEAFEMFRAPYAKKDECTHYGFGIEIRKSKEYVALEHEGVIAGYRSYLGCDMDAGIGVMVMQNGPGDATTLGRYVLESAAADRTGRSRPKKLEPDIFAPVDEPEKYTGTYYGPAGEELRIGASDDRLALVRAEGEIMLDQVTTDHFFADHPDLSAFPLHFHCEDGRAWKVTHGATTYMRDHKTPESAPVPHEWKAFAGHYRGMTTLLANFRVVVRDGDLLMVTPDGSEEKLVLIEARCYRVGEDPRLPEWLEFDEAVNGEVLRVSLAGTPYYRTFTEVPPRVLSPAE
jgi:CubicO group peptidase (beta-lactamase class C family)